MEEGENPPIGIVLCSEKSEAHVEYALGGLGEVLPIVKTGFGLV
jgi:hypothetical protein